MRQIAYLRDSKSYQIEVEQLKLDPVEYDEVYIDIANSRTYNRPEFEECLATLDSDAILHVQSADRLAHDAIHFRKSIQKILATGAQLKLHEENIIFKLDNDTDVMLRMLDCVADLESRIFTEFMLESKVIKRKKKTKQSRFSYSEEEMMGFFQRHEAGESVTEIAKNLSITTSTLYRIISRIKKRTFG